MRVEKLPFTVCDILGYPRPLRSPPRDYRSPLPPLMPTPTPHPCIPMPMRLTLGARLSQSLWISLRDKAHAAQARAVR
jgi:hypothetical protein